MWKILVLIAAAYILYRLFANDIKRKLDKNTKESEADFADKVASGDMVKDPECGAYVAADNNITVRDGEKVLHFCSYDCRDAYLKRLESGGRVLPEREKAE